MSGRDLSPRRDVHAEITNQLIALIEANPGEPQMPWHRSGVSLGLPINALSNRAYSGVNVISLWCASLGASFSSARWATYRQWTEKGCQVRKGEKGSPVIFYRQYAVDADPDDADDDGQRRVARLSIVFNADQVDGDAEPEQDPLGGPKPGPAAFEPIPEVETFLAGTGADIRHGGDQAFYDRRLDQIQLPPREAFIGTATASPIESFYGVAFHELGHWTGAEHRLNRVFGQRFGDQDYVAEELVAEITAAFLCAELEVTPTPRPDHAQYVGYWLRLFHCNKRALFSAAAKAAEAARFLHQAISIR
jgi:antirestriction protein ArdC